MKEKTQKKINALADSEIFFGEKSIVDTDKLREVVDHCRGL